MSTVVNRVHRRVTRWTKVHPCASVKLGSSVSMLRCFIHRASVRESVATRTHCCLALSLVSTSQRTWECHCRSARSSISEDLLETRGRYCLSSRMSSFSSLWILHHLSTESNIYSSFQVWTAARRLDWEASLAFSVRILGLNPETSYQIKIYAEQVSTRLLSKSVYLSFTTERASESIDRSYPLEGHSQRIVFYSVSKLIGDIQFRRLSFETVLITWSSDDFDQYQLRYWSLLDSTKKMLVILNSNNFTLVTTTESYQFQIRGHTEQGWTVYTKEQLISLRSMLIEENRAKDARHRLVENKTVLLIGPVAILGLIVLVVLLALIYSKK